VRRVALALAALIAVIVAAAVLWPKRRALVPAERLPETSAPSVVAPAPRLPTSEALRPGEEVTVDLLEAPAAMYGQPPSEGQDWAHEGVVRELGRRDVVYDALLGRAARELANQQAIFDGTVPDDVLDFVLRSSGAVDLTVMQGYSATNREGMSTARAQVEMALARAGGSRVRVGVGEVWKLGAPLPRVLGVVVSRREIEIEPTPRRIEPGQTWSVRGVLPSGFREPSAVVMFGGRGKVERLSMDSDGARFRVEVSPAREQQSFTVAVSAVGPHGGMPLLQLPVEVGREPPSSFTTRAAPDESEVRTVEAAEALALALLNADRARFSLGMLERDRQLDAVARAHSEDMRDNGFFGHVSPTTGGPSDRLARARVRTIAHGENVASGNSLHELEQALLASLPHRQNVLADGFTRVGIGVAQKDEGGRTVWHLTQLFGELAESIDAADWKRRLEQAMASMRQESGQPALTRDATLEGIADRHARLPETDATRSDGLLDAVQRAGLGRAGAVGWVATAVRFDQLSLPARVKDEPMRRFGLGVFQAADDPHGTVRVALVLAGEDR
jgi:uncharacterized protein YkwD